MPDAGIQHDLQHLRRFLFRAGERLGKDHRLAMPGSDAGGFEMHFIGQRDDDDLDPVIVVLYAIFSRQLIRGLSQDAGQTGTQIACFSETIKRRAAER